MARASDRSRGRAEFQAIHKRVRSRPVLQPAHVLAHECARRTRSRRDWGETLAAMALPQVRVPCRRRVR